MTYFRWPGVGYSTQLDLSDMIATSSMSSAAAKNVKKRRIEGTDNTVFRGMSKKSEELNRKQLPPATMKSKRKDGA